MKGRNALFITLIFCSTLVSCAGDGIAKKPKNSIETNIEKTTPKQVLQSEDVTSEQVDRKIKPRTEWSLADISFNNGLKWKANVETSKAIESMDDALDVFLLTEDHTLQEYNEFAALLSMKYQNIFKVCTMRGAGHDELHKMLVQVNFYLEKMASSDLSEVKKGCDQLHKQLHLYDVYFE